MGLCRRGLCHFAATSTPDWPSLLLLVQGTLLLQSHQLPRGFVVVLGTGIHRRRADSLSGGPEPWPGADLTPTPPLTLWARGGGGVTRVLTSVTQVYLRDTQKKIYFLYYFF